MRISLCLLAALTTCGCHHHEVPPLGTSSEASTVGTEAANDPIRLELRRFYAECEDRREVLQTDVDRADQRLRRISGAAAVAWFIGEMAAGRGNGRAVLAHPTGRDCLPGDGPGTESSACGPGGVTAIRGGQPSPAVEEAQSVELDADSQIRAINRAIHEADDLLFEHPDPDQWTQTEEDRWAQLLEVLEALCL